MTAVATSRRSPVVWVLMLVVVALLLGVAFLGRSQPSVGGFADPDGTGPEGLRALRLFVEETGGSTVRNLGLPDDRVDVAILAFAPILPINPGLITEEELPEPDWDPLLDWVSQGGVLVTSVDADGGPLAGTNFVEDEDLVVPRGTCSVTDLAGVQEIRPLIHQPIEVDSADQSCFGDGDEAVVVVRAHGEGRIVRLGSIGAFTNRALDDADNGALAARLLGLNDTPTVSFMPRAPVWFVRDADGEIVRDAEGQPQEDLGAFGIDGQPIDEDGNPIGSGQAGLLELIPQRVLALLAGLAGALFLYALARGRRLGSPIEEPIPVELPSSSYVEAVGRAFERVEDARGRSAAIVRNDLRTDIARRVGMPAESQAADLAGALSSGRAREDLIELLDGTPPNTDDDLVVVTQRVAEARERIDRGGVASLAPTETLGSALSADSDKRKDPS